MRTTIVWAVISAIGIGGAAPLRSSEFTETGAAAAEALLGAHFQGKNGAIVVGLIDDEGSKIVAVGTLDDGSGRAADGDSVFFIGSVTKTFTALLLADMAARGEVKLDDPVAMYLPDSVHVPAHGGKQITLLHLATNTAGLPPNPDNMAGADVREQYESYTIEKMYDFLEHFHLSRQPGAEYEYSNLGMSLLGHALSRKAGASYESLIVERICRPLGMESTCVHPTPAMSERLAMGRDEKGASTGPWQLDAYAPAGAIHSTASDLLKYAAAHAGITRSALEAPIAQTHAIRVQGALGPADGSGSDRFFGRTAMPWMDRTAFQPPGMELLGHAGGAGSYHAWVGFDLQQRRGVAVLSTANDLTVEAVGWTLLQRMPLTPERLRDFAHDFVGIGTALELTADGGELRITTVMADSPAADAGLTAGLIIRSIDDVATAGKKLPDCVALLRGPAGAKVRLGLYDPMSQESRTVDLTRRKFRT